MREVFKPIVTSLEKLVDRTHEIPIKNEMTEEIKQNDTLWQDAFETGEDEDKNVKDKSELAEASFRTIQDDDDDGDNDENDKYDNNAKATMIEPDQLLDQYTAMLSMNRKRDLDVTWGVRSLAKEKLMIGNSEIHFKSDHIHEGNTNYKKNKRFD